MQNSCVADWGWCTGRSFGLLAAGCAQISAQAAKRQFRPSSSAERSRQTAPKLRTNAGHDSICDGLHYPPPLPPHSEAERCWAAPATAALHCEPSSEGTPCNGLSSANTTVSARPASATAETGRNRFVICSRHSGSGSDPAGKAHSPSVCAPFSFRHASYFDPGPASCGRAPCLASAWNCFPLSVDRPLPLRAGRVELAWSTAGCRFAASACPVTFRHSLPN